MSSVPPPGQSASAHALRFARNAASVSPALVMRGSSIDGQRLRRCPRADASARMEYLPGTASGPLGPSGRVALIHGPP